MWTADDEHEYWRIRDLVASGKMCCPLGERVHCVCRHSVKCVVHGWICMGTHD